MTLVLISQKMNTQIATLALSLKEVSEYTNSLGITKAYNVKTPGQISAAIDVLNFEILETVEAGVTHAIVTVSKKDGTFIAAGYYADGQLRQSLKIASFNQFKTQF